MLHAPTNGTKRRSDQSSTHSVEPRQQDLHPQLGTSASTWATVAASSLPFPSAIGQRRPQLARLQSTYGNQAVLRMLRAQSIQPELTISEPRDTYEIEADGVAQQIMAGEAEAVVHAKSDVVTKRPLLPSIRSPEAFPQIDGTGGRPLLPVEERERPTTLQCAHGNRDGDFSRIAIFPLPRRQGASTGGRLASSDPSIPTVDGEEDFVDLPPAVGPSAPSPGPAATACDAPLSMSTVISGAFQGSLSMDDYYPDLVGGGYWQHGGSGGPFDTGTRAGSNAQLVGTIQIPCRPDLFSLAQTVKYVKTVRDGIHHPDEGKTMDDIAKSGRDASRPPFRQEFAEMGASGLAISMADPPSVSYGPASNIEWDRSFVTSLVGPGGRKDVSWSTSIRVVNGSVTRNTIS